MSLTHLHTPNHPNKDVPDEFEPGAPPVEPDEGPLPIDDPDDPGHERIIDPGANRARVDEHACRQVEVLACP